MDISTFSDKDFDSKKWINETFASAPEEITSESKVSSITASEQLAGAVIMKLQLSIQELSGSLEDSCQQILQNIPRIVRELDAVQQESKILQDQMKLVKDDIQKVEQDTAHSMEQLLALDSVKGRVLEASSALKEADNWTTLTSDVEAVFETGDLQAIRQKIVGMQQSLELLKDVPDFEERHALLESLRNRIEALMSPMIVAGLTAESVETVQTHVEIFRDINRVETISKRYQECQKSKLLLQWKEFCESVSVSAEEKMIDRLPVLYNDILLPAWYAQLKWCGLVFGPSESALLTSQVIISTLHDLVPSMSSCLAQIVRECSEAPISALIQSRKISEGFCQRILMDMSQSRAVAVMQTLLQAIFEPYYTHVASFGDYAQTHLLKELERIPLSHSDDVDSAHLLTDSVTKVFCLATESLEKCFFFTNGMELKGLQAAVVTMMKEYVKDFRRVLTNLKARHSSKEKSGSERTVVDHDWEEFQQALRIVHITGELILKMEELDAELVEAAVSQLAKLEIGVKPTPDAAASAPDRMIVAMRCNGKHQDQREQRLVLMLEELTKSSSFLGEKTLEAIRGLAQAVQNIAFNIIFNPLKDYLKSRVVFSDSESVSGEQLPSFTESEYITEVGQYLMTVPQQLEPFAVAGDDAMKTAVCCGQLESSNQNLTTNSGDFDLAGYWLDAICQAFTRIYSESILRIVKLSSHATKQLILDLEYLHVVFEDLGVQSQSEVNVFLALLKAEPSIDIFQRVAGEMDAAPGLVTRIAKMRGIDI